MAERPHRGPVLPYRPLAGVVPFPGGWLVMSGKLQGITLSPDGVHTMERFEEVLDYSPSFEVLAVAAPIGLLAEPRRGGRSCEVEARALLGLPRARAVASAPSRRALDAETYEEAARLDDGMSAPQWLQLRRFADLDRTIQPYHQRSAFEVHPELSFFQINDDTPLRYGKHTFVGRDERRELLLHRLPGIERFLDVRPPPRAKPAHLLDAGAALWTSRRIASRSVQRVPEDAEWDDSGLRVEMVR